MATVTRLTVIKLLELVLVCVLIGMHYSNGQQSHTQEFLIKGTFGGYLIILIGLFAGGVMGTPVNRRIDLYFSLIGCVLFIVCGALVVSNYTPKGVLGIVEGVIFLIDAVLTFRGEA